MNSIGRPRVPDEERHDHEFRLRLKDEDAMLTRALAKKLGLAPAELLRTFVRAKLQESVNRVPSDRIMKALRG